MVDRLRDGGVIGDAKFISKLRVPRKQLFKDRRQKTEDRSEVTPKSDNDIVTRDAGTEYSKKVKVD